MNTGDMATGDVILPRPAVMPGVPKIAALPGQVLQQADTREYTGGSVSYYQVAINNPTDPENKPYVAECNDIIEALQLDYAEGNALKAIWRLAAARLGKSKRGYKDGTYDAEKVVFFGERMVVKQKSR